MERNHFTPFIDAPQRKASMDELVDRLIEVNARYSQVVSFCLAAPVVFIVGFAIAMRL